MLARSTLVDPTVYELAFCGHACHTAVKAKNYFHPYRKRCTAPAPLCDVDTGLLWEVQPIAQQAAA